MAVDVQAALKNSASGKKTPYVPYTRKPKADLNTPEGLQAYADSIGQGGRISNILNPEKKLSALQRLSAALSSFNPANAILEGIKQHSIGAGIKEYGKDIALGIGSGITGHDYLPDRKMFKDVAEEAGVTNGVAKFGIGFLGDVLLDPSTYFGMGFLKTGLAIEKAGLGEAARVGEEAIQTGRLVADATGKLVPETRAATDVIKTLTPEARVGIAESPKLARIGQIVQHPIESAVGAAAEGTLKTIGKVSPEVEAGLRQTGKGIKDTFGNLFTAAYNTSEGLKDSVLSFYNKLNNMRNGISKETVESFRTVFGDAFADRLPEYFDRSVAGKIGEHEMRNILAEQLVERQNQELKELGAMRNGTEKFLSDSEKVALKDVPGIGGVTAARLEHAGFSTSRLANAATEGVFHGDEFVPMTYEIADKLGISVEEATRMSDAASNTLDYAARNNAEYQAQAADIAEKIAKVKQYKIDFDAAGDYGTMKALENADPLMAQLYKEQKLINMEYARKSGIAEPWHNYYPFRKDGRILEDDKPINDLIMAESKNSGLRVGSQGWRKKFENLVGKDAIIQNPVEAESLVRGEMATDLMKKEYFDEIVQRWGKPLDAYKDGNEALKDGYRLWSTKGTAGGIPLGERVGWVKADDFNFLNGQVNNQYPSISALAKATGFDAIQGLFKRSVTVPFVPFHVRNFVSGMLQNFEVFGLKALDPTIMANAFQIAKLSTMGEEEAIKGTIKYLGKDTDLKDLFKPFFDLFSSDPRQFEEMARAFDTGILPETNQFKDIISKGTLKKTVSPTSFLGQDSAIFKGGRAVSNMIEVQQKAVAYMAALQQGSTIPQALEKAATAGFNYAALTPFESQIMKRLIPFYSFTKFNIALQLKTLGEHPERINQILRLVGNFGERPSAEDKKGLPDFIAESLGTKFKNLPNGLVSYLARFGTPIESFTDLVGGNQVLKGISMMSPLLKVPIELGIGKDSFRETDLKDTYTANDLSILPDFVKAGLDMTPVQKPVLRKNKITGKLEKVGEETQWVADPVKLLIFRSLFTSRGATYLDQMFDGDLHGMSKVMNLTSGLKTYTVNPEAQVAYKEKAAERAAQDELIKRAGLKEFSTVYKPK